MYFQDLILTLQKYWNEKGCLLTQPYDVEKGAGTFNPTTFLRALGPEPFSAAYAEPCRRPADGRYGDNPIRMQHYYQFQVILKPNPKDILDLYIGSLKAIGIQPDEHDIRFVHDDWETAALGAWGLGWEVWCDGTEITQFTYFQQVGGLELPTITGEITYGLERICMFLQKKSSVFDIEFNEKYSYGDIFHQNEVQFSKHNFELADVSMHYKLFEAFEKECENLCEAKNPAPALDYAMKASHSFNILDARNAISVNERQGYVLKIRKLAKQVAECWLENRESLGYPLLGKVAASQDKALLKSFPTLKEEKAPLLIELGVEEMPAKVFPGLMRDLPQLWKKHFADLGLESSEAEFYYSPRRICIKLQNLQTKQPDKHLVLKGPPAKIAKDKEGNWTKAALGFAAKNKLNPDNLEIKTIDGGEYLYAETMVKGKNTVELLSEFIPQLFSKIHWYKTMRWGLGDNTPFVRPVQWLVALLGKEIIPTEFAGVSSSNKTMGHRFMANHEIEVNHENYFDTLREHHVYANHLERRNVILQKVEECAKSKGLSWRQDSDLLDEVNFLVENPIVVLGEFDAKYLEIPEEVAVSEMREHQKYLALVDSNNKLHNSFIAISNTQCKDEEVVKSGYENVLVSRLFDAEFFLKEDQKQPLIERVAKLSQVNFEESLGSVLDKTQRMDKTALFLGNKLESSNSKLKKQISEACKLCKTDLTTAMVYEFPDLQGEVGRFYAEKQGLDAEVSTAIKDHYLPKNATDDLSPSLVASLVGIADRIDSIVGLFSVGKGPTGSADPYAIRRACLGCILIIRKHELGINISELIDESIKSYGSLIEEKSKSDLKAKILDFFLQRLKKLLQEPKRPNIDVGDIPPDIIQSVVQANVSWDNIHNFIDRVKAMNSFRQHADFGNVSTTFKRVSNILKETINGEPKSEAFVCAEEKELWESSNKMEPAIQSHLAKGEFVEALECVAGMRPLVDNLFEKAMINDPDPAIKENRQRLIQKLKSQVSQVADFSALQD